MKVILDLPYPPSGNTYYRRSGHHMHISDKGRAFKHAVGKIVMAECPVRFGDGRVRLQINFHPKNKIRRDIDNIAKPILDSLIGLYDDDSQVDELLIVRCDQIKGGGCTVIIEAIDD